MTYRASSPIHTHTHTQERTHNPVHTTHTTRPIFFGGHGTRTHTQRTQHTARNTTPPQHTTQHPQHAAQHPRCFGHACLAPAQPAGVASGLTWLTGVWECARVGSARSASGVPHAGGCCRSDACAVRLLAHIVIESGPARRRFLVSREELEVRRAP